ncbi:MAG: NPCBM/NEW2 domain-containing protein [Abditibacteriota bacterium]|nr:NPCBM/NEW2 domain-containing protein [Abditibacteriota bacterium]
MKLILMALVPAIILWAMPVFAANISEFADSAFGGEKAQKEDSNRYFEILQEFEPGKTTKINRCVHETNQPICLGGREYDRGIGTHAPGRLRITLDEPIREFRSKAGIDSQMAGTPASVRAYIYADGKTVWQTEGAVKGDNSVLDIALAFDGAESIELALDNAEDGPTCDQWDWAEAYVVGASGKKYYLDTLAGGSKIEPGYPFSFKYGGVSSGVFLPQWQFEKSERQADNGVTEKTYVYADPDTGLEVKAIVKVYEREQALDWTLYFDNKGTENTPVISDVKTLDLRVNNPEEAPAGKSALPTGLMFADTSGPNDKNDVIVLTTAGSIGCARFNWDEFKLTPHFLQEEKPIEIRHGSLSACGGEYSPYFAVKWPTGGIVSALGWSGTWEADFSREDKELSVSAGRSSVNTYLKPGETLRSARSLTVFYEGTGLQEGFNCFRRAMIRHIIPKLDGKPAFIPLAYSTSGKEAVTTTEEIDRAYIKSFRDLSFEVSWFDAWYHRNAFPAGMGNYHFPVSDLPDPVRFPHGMKPLTNLITAYGKKVMMWFAPENVVEGTFLAEEHPEWVMTASGKPGGGSFALVDPEAYDYMKRFLLTCFKEWDVSIFRTDSGTDLNALMTYTGETAPDRQGIAEDRFVTALYRFWDDLRAEHPGLLIDNCSGGGTRLELELMSRSITLWRSDSNVWVQNDDLKSARLNQLITSNLNHYIPWSTGGTLAVTPYSLRSGFNTGISFCGDTRPADYPKAELEKGLQECKRLRKYHLGDFYSLFNVDNTASSVCAWQYHRPDEEDGYAVVFRREECPWSGIDVPFKAIDENARYRISLYETYDLKETGEVSGKELQNLNVVIADKPGSLLIEYARIK